MTAGGAHHPVAAAVGPARRLVPYNHCEYQCQRIKAFLIERGPVGALAFEIQEACGVPCVTKRISDMVRHGVPITKARDRISGPHGVNEAVRYFLLEPDTRQGVLDLGTA